MNPTRTIIRRGVGWLSVLAVLVLAPVAWAGDDDPFAPENFVDFKREAARAVPGSKARSIADQIEFEVSLTPRDVRRGEVTTLTIFGTPKPGWRTYPITERSGHIGITDGQPSAVQDESGLDRMTITDIPGLKALWPLRESEPQWKVMAGQVYRAHTHPFTWSQDILVLPDAEPGVKTLRFSLRLYLCDQKSCLPPSTHTFETRLTVTGAPPVALTPELQKRLEEKKPAVKVLEPPDELKQKADELKRQEEEDHRNPLVDPKDNGFLPADPPPTRLADESLIGLLVASSLAALGMLFTPCVFPMIPITVSFFLKQAEKKNYNAKLTAGVYALTIIVVLSTAVLLLGQLVIRLANNPWLNLGFGVLLVVFSLTLFGMYELELPSFLTAWTSSRERQGGYIGAVFMALTFTLTSFTCTGPFLGPLLVAAKEFNVGTLKLVLAALVYSATFAAPFFLMALFPQLLKRLPKSGSWLNSVKVVMGFIELGAAVKFLAITDATWNPGNPWFFTYDTVFCLWIALSFACGLYLLGVYRLPHDSPLESVGVPRLLLASLFFALAVYMTPALWREVPQGVIGTAILSFAPQDTRPSRPGGDSTSELAWHTNFEKAWAQAKREKKLLFIDFTGINCSNCRQNENGPLRMPEIEEELKKYVRVKLYTDRIPDPRLTAEQSEELALRNLALQENTFGELSLPFYAIIKPDPEKVVEGGKLGGTVLGQHGGLIRDSRNFFEMLRRPHTNQVAQAGAIR
jgi:thiol:disulfide interchange protein